MLFDKSCQDYLKRCTGEKVNIEAKLFAQIIEAKQRLSGN